MTHTRARARAGRYTNINYELRYCSVQFSNRKGRDLKHALCVSKRGRARVVITERVSERQFIIKMLGPHY